MVDARFVYFGALANWEADASRLVLNSSYPVPLNVEGVSLAMKYLTRSSTPIAAETALNQTGSIVADDPITGIMPLLSCLTSERYVASAGPSASVRITSGLAASSLATSVRYEDCLRSIA